LVQGEDGVQGTETCREFRRVLCRSPKGKVVTTSTGYGSDVVLPQYDIDVATITRQTCVDLYVGKAMLAKASDAYKASADWAKSQRTNEVPTEGFDQNIVNNSIQHNVIKPIEDDIF